MGRTHPTLCEPLNLDFCAILLARSYWDGNVLEGKQVLPDVMGSDVTCCAIPSVRDMVHNDNLLNQIRQSYKNDPIFRQPTGSAWRNSKFQFDESTGIWTYLDKIYIPKGGEIKRRDGKIKGNKERCRLPSPTIPVRGVHNGHTDSAIRAEMRTFRMDTPRMQTNLPCFSADNNDTTWRNAVM